MIGTIKIPTLIGVGVLLVGLVAGLFLIRQEQQLGSKASENGLPPQAVTIANISDRGFAVGWTTTGNTAGFLELTQDGQEPRRIVDDRDRSGLKPVSSSTHYVSVESLTASTSYRFRVGTGTTSLFDQGGVPYSVTTAPALSNAPPPDSAQGIVLTSLNTPAQGALVYAQLPEGQLLSTQVTSSGNWIVPLSTVRTKDLSGWLPYDKNLTIYTLKINGGTDGLSEAVLTTAGDRPTPPIILGQTYDFRQGRAPLAQPPAASLLTPELTPETAIPTQPVAREESTAFNFSELGTVQSLGTEITLENPNKDGEILRTLKPEFFGKGPVGTSVGIVIESAQSMNGTVSVTQAGSWSFSPPAALTPGEHMIILKWNDAQGVVQTLSRAFSVSAATGPAFTATESATPTLPQETLTPTTGITLPTPTTKALTPTRIPSPTQIPQSSVPATESGTPSSGNLTPSLAVFMMGILFTFAGFVLVNKNTLYGRR